MLKKLEKSILINNSIGIMQPYYFPYWGHFSLIESTEYWVVFDIPQYTPKKWINRNKILNLNKDWQYLSVSLSNSSIHIRIFEAEIFSLERTFSDHLKKLNLYRNKAPYFKKIIYLFENCFSNLKSNLLVDLNISTLTEVCNYLGINFNYKKASELDLVLCNDIKAGEWALNICKNLGYSNYINPISGKEIFNTKAYIKEEINLYFQELEEFKYNRGRFIFNGNLSILDTMMWLSPSEIKSSIIKKSKLISSK